VDNCADNGHPMSQQPGAGRPESRAEREVREAAERGAFDNLPGTGKPLPGLDRPFSAQQWARDWVERSGGDPQAFLSPLLILRRERAALLESLVAVPSEADLRELVADFNHRLLQEYRRPMDGPLIPVGVIDPDETVQRWRGLRPDPAPSPVPAAPADRPARRWFSRRWFARRWGGRRR